MSPPYCPYIIRLALHGCTNRPFYHIVVAKHFKPRDDPGEEQLGSYDPMPNKNNQKLVSFNFQRLRYWLGEGAKVSQPVEELLGLCGFFPIHPRTYMQAKRNKKIIEGQQNQSKEENTTTPEATPVPSNS